MIDGSASISAADADEDADADIDGDVMGDVVDRGLGRTLDSALMFARAESDSSATTAGGEEMGGGADVATGGGEEMGGGAAGGGTEKLSGEAPKVSGGAGGAFGTGAPARMGISGRLIRTDVSALLISESSSSRSCGLPVAGCPLLASGSAGLAGAADADTG